MVMGPSDEGWRQRRRVDRCTQSHRQAEPDENEEGRPRLLLSPNVGKEIVGIVEVFREHHPDPTADKGEPWVVVDVKALEPLPQPVTLDAIKKEPKLKDMALVKLSRLSVGPVTADEWKLICKMGGMK